MAASIFKAAWWPIHVAVAWVLTRNRALVERSNRAGRSLRSIAVAIAMDKVRAKPTRRYFKRATKAWSALREEIAAGNVRASGTPFRRVADLESGAVNTSGMAREIPAVEIASLRLQDDGNDKDCLVPEDWRVAHGSNRNNLCGYRNVTVFRDDVLRVFDAEGATRNVPDWERLPEVVKRVVASVLTQDQPKQASVVTEDQANASVVTEDQPKQSTADRKIEIRSSIAREEGGASFREHVVGTVRGGGEIEIPLQLAPVRLKKPKRGRPAEYNWDGVKARLSDHISQHGPMQTLDELMQKCADFAHDLHPKKSTPSDKTIREAIKTHALDIAASFSPGKSPGK